MPAERHRKLSVRFAPDGYRRLRVLAQARGVSLSGPFASWSTRLPQMTRLPNVSVEQLLDLLRERAEDGNVSRNSPQRPASRG
jgi:hypothetical protein